MREFERFLVRAAPWIAPFTLVTALVIGAVAGLAPAILTVAFGMLLGAVLLLWSSLGRLTGESPLTLEEAVGLGAPSPEEERKRSILRALKDLEYERSVGKISEEDFAELSTRYRTEAKALLRALEAELAPRREKAEAKLQARLKKEGVADRARSKKASARRVSEPSDAQSQVAAPGAEGSEQQASPIPKCPSCQTPNDPDARFCKRCGTVLHENEAVS